MPSYDCEACDFVTSDRQQMGRHYRSEHGLVVDMGDTATIVEPDQPPAEVLAQRYADDPLERIEWQLDQIRVNTLALGLVAALILVGGIVLAVMALASAS